MTQSDYLSINLSISIYLGQDHSMLLTDEGKVFSTGWGADGQTGLGHYNNQDSFALVEGDIKVRFK